jgi:hypothetical protein
LWVLLLINKPINISGITGDTKINAIKTKGHNKAQKNVITNNASFEYEK